MRQTLAPHVADEQPDSVRRIDHLVEVAADAGLRRGRQVQRLDLDIADAARHRAQHHLLRGVRHEPYLEEGALPLEPDMASVRGGHGDRDDPRGRPPRSQIGEDEAQADHQDEADRPEQDSGQHRPHGGGQGRRRGQEAAEGHLRGSGVGQAGDHDGEEDRRKSHDPPPAVAPTEPRPS